MTRADPNTLLASYDEPTTVRGRIHSIPPHEVYEVEFGGRRAVCKIGTESFADPAVEARVLEHIDERTVLSTPEALAVGPNHFVAAFDDRVPDDPTLDEARIRATGRGLARLHAETLDEFGSPGLLDTGTASSGERNDPGPLTVDSFDRWSDTLDALVADHADYLETVGFREVAERVRTFVQNHRAVFDTLQDNDTDPEPALLHGNFLPEHVGVDRSGDTPRVSCVIDAEHALVGDPVYDLLRTGAPAFGPPWRAADDEGWETLRSAYESVRPLPADVRERFHWHGPILGVSYLRALHVQRGDRDRRQAIARRAVRFQASILKTVHELRGNAP